MHHRQSKILNFGVLALSIIGLIGTPLISASTAQADPIVHSEEASSNTEDYSSALVIVKSDGSEIIEVDKKTLTIGSVLRDRSYKPENFITNEGKVISAGDTIDNGEQAVVYAKEIIAKSETIDIPVADKITVDNDLYEGQKFVKSAGKVGKALKTTVIQKNLSGDKSENSADRAASISGINRKIASEEEIYLTILEVPEAKLITIGGKKCDYDYVCDILAEGKGSIKAEGSYVHPLGKTESWATYFGSAGHEAGAVDIPMVSGTPIYAVADGTVTDSGWLGTGGNMVVISHADGYLSGYAHMVSTPVVKAGEKVKAGQLIGLVGSTGNSTGPHLHFEIFKGKIWNIGVPAYDYMKLHGVDLGPCSGGPCNLAKKS